MSVALEVTAELRLLRARPAFAEVSAALARCAQTHDADTLHAALALMDELPSSLQRLAWVRSFGGSLVTRVERRRLTEALWHTGINRVAGAMADPSGAVALLALALAAPDRTRLLADLERLGAFVTLYADAGADVLAADAALLALRVDDDAALAELHDVRVPEQLVVTLARWLHGLRDGRSVAPPTHPATVELLTAPWARGFRRRAVRRAGHAASRSTPIEVPAALISADPIIHQALAPLVVEWLVPLLAGLASHGDAATRAGRLEAAAPGLAARLFERVPPDGPSGGALRALLDHRRRR